LLWAVRAEGRQGMVRFVAALMMTWFMVAAGQAAEALLLFDGKTGTEFAGCLNCNRYEESAVCNRYGDFGSRYSDTSIWNRYGKFGSTMIPMPSCLRRAVARENHRGDDESSTLWSSCLPPP